MARRPDWLVLSVNTFCYPYHLGYLWSSIALFNMYQTSIGTILYPLTIPSFKAKSQKIHRNRTMVVSLINVVVWFLFRVIAALIREKRRYPECTPSMFSQYQIPSPEIISYVTPCLCYIILPVLLSDEMNRTAYGHMAFYSISSILYTLTQWLIMYVVDLKSIIISWMCSIMCSLVISGFYYMTHELFE
jgi:hypothetical protein